MASLFETLRANARQVEIDGVHYWVVEGDRLLDEDQLKTYAQEQEERKQKVAELEAAGLPLTAMAPPGIGLPGFEQDNRIVRWAPGVELTYAVLRKQFEVGGDAGYEFAVETVRQAADDWEDECGVRFVHKHVLDGSEDLWPEGALFTVREYLLGDGVVATSFFPNDPVNRRRLLIDPLFYSPHLDFDKVGIMRHELGHILGFRHEHIRPDAAPGCPGEEDTYGLIDLTKYDPKSVMHYFCGKPGERVGTKELILSEDDKEGARAVYGPSLKRFYFVT